MIETSCVYLQRNGCWLMLYRNKKKNDVNEGKWIGIGGKRENNESMADCAIREVEEETGYLVDALEKEGIVDFLYPDREPERIHVYICQKFHGHMHACNEGKAVWIKEDEIMRLQLWEGDRLFLKRMMNQNKIPFHFVLHYNTKNELTAEEEILDE